MYDLKGSKHSVPNVEHEEAKTREGHEVISYLDQYFLLVLKTYNNQTSKFGIIGRHSCKRNSLDNA